VIDLLGAFLTEVKNGNNLSKTKLTGQTLRNYVKAATDCCSLLTGSPMTITDLATLTQKKAHMHPYLQELISQRSHWAQPKPRKEPYTYRMLATQARFLVNLQLPLITSFLQKEYVVWDWLRLGVFTGSRLSEYAQSNLRKGQRFHIVPFSNDTGVCAGQPLAFIRADFTFYDKTDCVISHASLYNQHHKRNVHMVHIRFRYDKSAENFSLRKFPVSADPILNPVDATVSILHRADLLQVPENEPVGVYGGAKGQYYFLRDSHVRDILRLICIRTYPDPTHYLRVHILRLVPHSNRVTAAVCLQMGGATLADIVFRLRWHIASVPTYLRECFQEVGPIMEQAISGAFKTS
jgi:hypothetical protein